MMIYNVTILITEAREEEFIRWMRTKHIKDVLATGLFEKATLSKLKTEIGTQEGVTYATQYFCTSQEKLEVYFKEQAPKLREEGLALFGENMLGFRTELEIIEEFTP